MTMSTVLVAPQRFDVPSDDEKVSPRSESAPPKTPKDDKPDKT